MLGKCSSSFKKGLEKVGFWSPARRWSALGAQSAVEPSRSCHAQALERSPSLPTQWSKPLCSPLLEPRSPADPCHAPPQTSEVRRTSRGLWTMRKMLEMLKKCSNMLEKCSKSIKKGLEKAQKIGKFLVRIQRGETTPREPLHVVGGYQHCIATCHPRGPKLQRW